MRAWCQASYDDPQGPIRGQRTSCSPIVNSGWELRERNQQISNVLTTAQIPMTLGRLEMRRELQYMYNCPAAPSIAEP